MYKVFLSDGSLTYDVTTCVSSKKTLSGQKSSAPRKFSFEIKRDTPIKIGDVVFFTNVSTGTELFRGIVLDVKATDSNDLFSITCYDSYLYFANNSGTFSFKNKTASQIFREICNKFKIPTGTVTETGHPIPKLEADSKKLVDIINQALSETFKATGIRYYVRDKGGKLELIKRVDVMHPWVIERKKNLISYDISWDGSDMANSVVLTSKDSKNKSVVVSEDAALIKRFGMLQITESVDTKTDKVKMKQKADSILASKKNPKCSFRVSSIGLDEIISGDTVCLYIDDLLLGPLKNEPFRKILYVDSDTHSFDENHHTMDLTLVETLEVENSDS